MPDISKCFGKDCTLKESCYRYTSRADYYQSYADFKQINGECEYFWEIDRHESDTKV